MHCKAKSAWGFKLRKTCLYYIQLSLQLPSFLVSGSLFLISTSTILSGNFFNFSKYDLKLSLLIGSIPLHWTMFNRPMVEIVVCLPRLWGPFVGTWNCKQLLLSESNLKLGLMGLCGPLHCLIFNRPRVRFVLLPSSWWPSVGTWNGGCSLWFDGIEAISSPLSTARLGKCSHTPSMSIWFGAATVSSSWRSPMSTLHEKLHWNRACSQKWEVHLIWVIRGIQYQENTCRLPLGIHGGRECERTRVYWQCVSSLTLLPSCSASASWSHLTFLLRAQTWTCFQCVWGNGDSKCSISQLTFGGWQLLLKRGIYMGRGYSGCWFL